MSAGKGVKRPKSSNIPGQGVMRTGKSCVTNFEMQRYCQNKPKFNGVHSRNNLRKIKDGGIRNKSWWIQINRN